MYGAYPKRGTMSNTRQSGPAQSNNAAAYTRAHGASVRPIGTVQSRHHAAVRRTRGPIEEGAGIAGGWILHTADDRHQWEGSPSNIATSHSLTSPSLDSLLSRVHPKSYSAAND